MTNVSSGQKRSWDGAENEAKKRPRDRDEPKDWRDVHLKSPGRKPSSGRHHGSDRGRRSPARHDSRRGGNSSSHRRRDADHRHERYPNDDRDSGRSTRRLDDNIRSKSPPRRTRSRSRTRAESRHDEREEGEISPRISRSPPSQQQPQVESSNAAQPQVNDTPQEKAPVDMDLDIPTSPTPVEDVLAARRAKRLAILAKYNGLTSVTTSASSSPGPSSAVQPPTPSLPSSNPITQTQPIDRSEEDVHADKFPEQSGTCRRDSMSVSPTPRDFTLAKEGENETDESPSEQQGADQVLAADYDPSLDRREDERKRFNGNMHVEVLDDEEEVEEEVEEEEEDIDDMFAVALSDKPKIKKVKKVKKPRAPALITTSTLDTAADPEGYYNVILGEQLDGGQYQVFSSLGKGMFANVVRARILQGEPSDIGREVAIKIIRCQESMYRAGLKEVQILNKLKQADPEDKKHIVRLERTFEHRGHLCLVFESMSMNLRDVVKRFGKDVGLNIKAVRAYAHQLFLALSLLRKANIMHADIKPDNILVNEQKTVLKLCDLGSASDASENDITPYLVSRFYRAPEIILGVPYDPSLDIWSIGCTLYELYTGKILFPGRSNNQMLLLMMELKGRFNSKMIKRAKFGDVYFDDMGGFESVENDRITGNDVVRKVHISKPTRDLRARLMPRASAKVNDEENKMLTAFIDLLDKCLSLDPTRRINPREALAHPFIRG
ncbi:kinase-like protein [Pholiota conissans]|uniref:non-specific serine/threonine protein kinase n=1 Tax=Pholiota conissans TaxID=109636 RepID=A0A9P5Z6W0_9AGAR|nr:kinase-like protein [Pholiota conissans]